MPNLTIVSNGHGEDVIGASLASAVHAIRPEVELRAFPLVDDGAAYRRVGVGCLGPCRVLPSGGATVHSVQNLVSDVRAGLLGATVAQLAELGRLRTDALVVVGDIYAQALSAVVRTGFRAVLQPLVSVYHAHADVPWRLHRIFMEGIRPPERWLMRRLADVVYTRDEPTAAWLQAHGVSQALALGNPMVDGAAGQPLDDIDGSATVALLPGSRSYRGRALAVMAEALALLPDVMGLVAWSGGALPALAGWQQDADDAHGVTGMVRALRHGSSRLWVLEDRFGDVLASASVALGTAGTANEQAAAIGLPVVSFALPPAHTAAFVANQRRLLGDALTICSPAPDDVAAAVAALLADGPKRDRAVLAGPARMGPPGGTTAVVQDLLARWLGT